MPAWDAYKEVARKRGALALELFAVESVPAGGPASVPENVEKHLEYQQEQESKGTLVLAGPVSNAAGDLMEGAGLIIYRAASIEEARAIADADPMHVSGARTYSLRRWLVNEGSLTISVGLSTRSVSLA
ncbi:YciI family protein [Labrenzia sp. CE80]|uniref:YciI family protein n=1 Tax=Labrenzia sp. CE80 TaxID=1788986 RepID=UPI00129B024E|nr:YciI family protein [Labrenzia sp. CE80]